MLKTEELTALRQVLTENLGLDVPDNTLQGWYVNTSALWSVRDWGTSDTEVVARVCDLAAMYLVGRPCPTYGAPDPTFDQDIQAAALRLGIKSIR